MRAILRPPQLPIPYIGSRELFRPMRSHTLPHSLEVRGYFEKFYRARGNDFTLFIGRRKVIVAAHRAQQFPYFRIRIGTSGKENY